MNNLSAEIQLLWNIILYKPVRNKVAISILLAFIWRYFIVSNFFLNINRICSIVTTIKLYRSFNYV